jgi:NADH:ubiquinone oxidoreductase subunit K
MRILAALLIVIGLALVVVGYRNRTSQLEAAIK